MQGSNFILRATGIVKTLGASRGDGSFTLGPINLDVLSGEVLALVGSSGAGKSTLLAALSGTVLVDSGESSLRLNGERLVISPSSGASWRSTRRHLGFVYQDPTGSLNPRRTILDQVVDPLRIHGLCTRSEARERAIEALEMVGIRGNLASQRPAQLSGGQRQRVAVARAMVHRPAVLFLDEPTSSLDPSVQAELLQVFRKLRGPDVSYVLVTHDLGIVRSIADRIAVVGDGQIVEIGDVEARFEDPRSVELRLLLAASQS